MAKTYYVRTDDNDVPFRLLRADGGTVAFWNVAKTEWVDVAGLSPMQFSGLGGSSDYQMIDEVLVGVWQEHFTALNEWAGWIIAS